MTSLSLSKDASPLPDPSWRAFVPIGLTLLSLLVSAFVGYAYSAQVVGSRLSVVETQQRYEGARLDRMEDKIDEVLRELRQR